MTQFENTDDGRLRRLEDRFDIQAVRYRYCYAVDERDWDALVSLFTEDASLEYDGIGTYHGHAGVREFGTDFVERSLATSAHGVHNPLISLHGDEATGKWYVTAPITTVDGTGGFRWGRYDERYRRVDDEWRIAELRLQFIYAMDYGEEGWSDWKPLQ